jgi:hypothetical protein
MSPENLQAATLKGQRSIYQSCQQGLGMALALKLLSKLNRHGGI